MTRVLIVLLCVVCSYGQLAYINLTAPYLIPESMDFDSNFGYIIGSVGLGNTRTVNPATGAVSVLVSNPEMPATFGIQVDKRAGRHRLLVCSGIYPPNATAIFQAGVAVIDLTSGTPTQTNFYDLTNVGPAGYGRLCNDLIADDAGNIYATDSFGYQVWKITTAGAISSYASNVAWKGTMTSPFGTDGIELTAEGNLIVGHLSDSVSLSTLWLVPTTGTVTTTQITISGGNVLGADGVYFGPSGCLYVVGAGKINRLKSTDGWQTATVLESAVSPCNTPTAVAYNGANLYVSCANNFGVIPAAIARVSFTVPETASLCGTSGVASSSSTTPSTTASSSAAAETSVGVSSVYGSLALSLLVLLMSTFILA